MDHRCHILYSRCTNFGICSNGLKAKIDRLVVGRIDPEYFPEPQPMNEYMRNINEMYSQIRIFFCEFQTDLCFSETPHSVQQERLSAMGYVGFSAEEVSEFHQVVSTSGEIPARRSPR